MYSITYFEGRSCVLTSPKAVSTAAARVAAAVEVYRGMAPCLTVREAPSLSFNSRLWAGTGCSAPPTPDYPLLPGLKHAQPLTTRADFVQNPIQCRGNLHWWHGSWLGSTDRDDILSLPDTVTMLRYIYNCSLSRSSGFQVFRKSCLHITSKPILSESGESRSFGPPHCFLCPCSNREKDACAISS